MDTFPNTSFADPSQFALAWDSVFETLTVVILFAFFVERVLSTIFESPWFINLRSNWFNEKSSIKPNSAIVVSIILAVIYKIDIWAITVGWASPSYFGCILTGFVIAGGSKASIKLFRDILGVKSNAYKEYSVLKEHRLEQADVPPEEDVKKDILGNPR